jgi:type II secretory pathway pseudopilin PulG
MKGKKSLWGITLIELLTVIAIIAVLAAILLPIFNRVKESTRQATCMSNLQEIATAVGVYKEDYQGTYPPLLLGYAERPDGLPWQSGDPAPILARDIKHGFLYRTYVKNIETFRCPDNPVTDGTVVVTAQFPPNAGWSGPVLFGTGGLLFNELPSQYANAPVPFYAIDSYDITSVLGAPRGTYQLVYARDWTGGLGPQDAPNQLKYPNPPLDRTVLAWCNYHATVAGADKSLVLLATGTVKPLDAKQMAQKGWQINP